MGDEVVNAEETPNTPSRGAVRELSGDDLDALLREHAFVVVDFGHSWCPVCQNFSPLFAELADRYGPTVGPFGHVEIDSESSMASKAQITTPTIVIFENGKEKSRLVLQKGIDLIGVRDNLAESIESLVKAP